MSTSKFKGKFQEACCANRNGGWGRLFDEYEAGFVWMHHCSCHVCELRREEEGIAKCVNKSCDGCKNLASGKKIRCYHKDILKGLE